MNEAIKILIWLCQKAQSLGIKGNALHRLEVAMLVRLLIKESSITLNSTSATGTITKLRSTDVFLAIEKLNAILNSPSLDGLAKDLGITKEGVQRLIWSLGDAQRTKNGSELFLSEMISLVRNAVLKERILKQTTTLLNTPLSLTKNKLKPMNRHLVVNAYGIKRMGERYVGNATA